MAPPGESTGPRRSADRLSDHGPSDDLPDSSLLDVFPRSAIERLWAFAIAAAFIAAVLGWEATELAARFAFWDDAVARLAPDGRGPPRGGAGPAPVVQVREEAEKRHTAVGMGFFGGALGLCCGTAGGLVRRSRRLINIGGWTGLLLGSAVGMIVAWTVVPLFMGIVRVPNPAIPLLVHTVCYASVGMAAALVLGWVLKGAEGAIRGCLAGAMGCLLGSVVFHVLQGILFPLDSEYSPMPGKSVSLLMGHLCVAISCVICAILALRDGLQRPEDTGPGRL